MITKPDPHVTDRLLVIADTSVLARPGTPLPKGTIIVKDLQTAMNWGSLGQRKYEDWVTLREEISGKLMFNVSKLDTPNWLERTHLFESADANLTRQIGAHLPKNLPVRIISDIQFDFKIIFYHLHFEESEANLGGYLLKSYLSGAWPCGWKGRYPKGKLVVYWPHEQPPEFELNLVGIER